jgi:hypothetical protein
MLRTSQESWHTRSMARIESADRGSYIELQPVHVTRGRGDSHDVDAVVCRVKFESYGEPVEGDVNVSRGGLARMIEKLKGFADKRAGMMQLRSDTQDLELSLAARRSKWTQKIRVTGLAGVPEAGAQQQDGPDEVRASFGITWRQSSQQGGSVEHHCGMVCTFDALAAFAGAMQGEFDAAPTRRGTGKVEPPRDRR